MIRERFVRLVEEALDALPAKFRARVRNLAVVVEDAPTGQNPNAEEDLLMGEFHGVPTTEESVWQMASGPNHIVLYQKNIEAVCETEEEIREEVRLTVLHELGHYFGMTEDQLKDVVPLRLSDQTTTSALLDASTAKLPAEFTRNCELDSVCRPTMLMG